MLSQISIGFFNAIKLWPEAWASTAAYAIGDVVKASAYNSHAYKCTAAGTTASTEPSWTTTNGGTNTDGTVTWTCYDPKTYAIVGPQAASVPYVTFGLETETPIGDFADFESVENMTFWVNAFSDKSMADVCEVADEVMDALDDAVVSASGFTSMKCVREFIGTPIYDIETRIFQVPMRWRTWLDKS